MAIDFKKKLTGGGSSQIDFVKRLNGLKLEEPQVPVAEERNSNFHPIKSFVEGFKEYKGEDRSFKSAFIDGDPVKEGGKVWSDSVVNLADRISKAVETPNTSWADYAADTGSVLLGGVNVALAPIMGAMKGVENIPVLGAAATLTNKLAAGLFGVGGNSAVSALRVAPFLSDETKAKLEPVVEELGGLVATIVGFKYAGKYGGKVKAKYIDPRTAKMQAKMQEVSRIIGEDPKLKAEIGKFVTEHGPVRTLPVTSETPGGNVPVSTPKTKHAAYAKSQGYEPIIPDSQLPVISIGDKASSKELPTIDATTGEVRQGAGTDVGQYQMSLNEAPKRPTSELLEESRNAPKEKPIEAPKGESSTKRGNGDVIKITDKKTGKSQEVIVISKKPDGSLVTTGKQVYFPGRTTAEKFDIEYLNKQEPYPAGGVTFGELEAMDRAAEAKGKATEKPKEKKKEEAPFLSEEYNNMLIEMELSEKGYRYQRGEHDATQSEPQWQGVSSTFPDWVPEKLRLRSLFDKYLKDRKGTTDDLSLQYKKGSRLDRLHQAFIEHLKFLEETNRAERETKRLMEEADAEIAKQNVKEDTSAAEAEYAKMQGEAPAQESISTGKQELMQPVVSTGEATTPALTRTAVSRLSEQMREQYKDSDLPMYNKANWDGIANKVIAEFNADPAYAMDIAMGRERLSADSGMTQTAFWVEAMHRAEVAGDAQMMLDLSRSKVSSFATAAGQEIGYLANLEKGDPGVLIKKINDSLKESFESVTKKSSAELVTKEIQTIERFIKESTLPKEKWIEVIKGIKDC